MNKKRRDTMTDELCRLALIPERSSPGVGNYNTDVPKLQFKTYGNGHSTVSK